ncbi:TrmH family RNA methyltransferase [Mycoplasma simbae]|uniref:TrmH family RNA methyltransferase n=1 Tax=Mycoplasma simbae TaxID=36744 RepID=UPI000496A52D|nr:RNA methyltransferase [Mycoplasma simbae]
MENKFISSTANETIKRVKKILAKGDENLFIIEGQHLINEAVNSGAKIEQIFELNTQNLFPNSIKITDNVLNSISTTKTPQGSVALVRKPQNTNVENNIVFCDNVQDPGNVGTIIRTALAFGFDTIYTNVDVYNPKIIRSTQGAIFKIKVVKYTAAEQELMKLKQTHAVYMTTLDTDSVAYDSISYPTQNKVIVLGNEGRGINPNLYKYATNKIYIPIYFESLNVAVAAGIILNECKRGNNEQ